jgi:2-polyprenyl-3-methyl-5-hydroxy-6-metoxy-1,4-benzoquinol methylase
VLDVGCGEGMLTRQVARARPGAQVVGIDPDEPSIELARSTTPDDLDIEYLIDDVMTHPFEPGSFDAVVSVAAAHHIGTEAAFRRFAELVRPGGVVGVVGFARRNWPQEVPAATLNLVLSRAARIVKPYWVHSAPMVWPPDVDSRSMRRVAAEVLPGSRCRSRVLGRWTVVWTRPQ